MWLQSETPVPLHPSQIVVGLFVWLDLPWDEHPFLSSRVQITEASQAAMIQELPVAGKLYYYPSRSTAIPPAPDRGEPATGDSTRKDSASEAISLRIAIEKQEKLERMQRQRDAAARADRAWERAAKLTHEALAEMTRAPRQAGARLGELSKATANAVAQGHDVVLHLIGDKQGEGLQHHALNVMTLSVLVGKGAGLDASQLADLALGALAHDVGKLQIPAHLLKAKARVRHEEAFVRQHSAFGVELAKQSRDFTATALSIIGDHHEYLDGSGWPKGKTDLGLATRIVSLVDRYDRLSSPESPSREALPPAEALARMFRHEAKRFDHRLLSMLIHLLGVYPPGTLVRLHDQSIALVVSPGKDSLRPSVLIYDPQLARDAATPVDLALFPELKIEATLRPAMVPPEVLDWLRPRQRLSYFFSTNDG